MAIWNCRIVEFSDEQKSFEFVAVNAPRAIDAAERYLGNHSWDYVSWEDDTDGVVEVAEDGFVGEPKRFRVRAYTAIRFGLEQEDE